MAKKHCPYCDAPMVEYPHVLSKGLARCLYRLAQAGGGPIHLDELKLTYNQRCNFQKLRYWDLVEKSDPENPKGGRWNLTPLGWQFVKGEIEISRKVWSYRAKFSRFEGPTIRIQDVADGWKYRPDYAGEAEPV